MKHILYITSFFLADNPDHQRYMLVSRLGVGWAGKGGHNWQKYFICLFHVSEHVDHFKARSFYLFFNWKIIPPRTNPPTPIGKFQLDFIFLFLKPSLNGLPFDLCPGFVTIEIEMMDMMEYISVWIIFVLFKQNIKLS